jgi:multidrug efflux pump subunit AcrB
MPSITGFALQQSRVTIAFMVLVVLGGISQFLSFPRQEDPPIVIREAVVTAQFPGMPPEQMKDLVTRRIEEQIRTMPEIDEITSDTKTGQTTIHAKTRDEYDNLAEIWKRLRNKMADLQPSLPSGTIGPAVNDEFGLTAIATIALWSDGFSMAEMRLVARDVRDRLYELEGIRKVELYGVQEEQVRLKFSNAKLSQFGLTPQQIFSGLVQQNVVLPGGSIDTAGQDIILSPSGSFTSVENIEDALIALPNQSGMVRISDVVEVQRGYADPPQALAYYNGRESIVISVSIVPGVNSVAFGDRLTAKLDALESELPVGYVLDYATFQPDLVVAAVDGALSNVYQTLAIVLIVVMLFLGLRTGLIVGSFVPLSMLLGLIVMRQFGIELERVSIVSAIVALGMLVDNAIVVAEDIRSRLERGQERRAACVEAGQTLVVPLLTSSLTTILAFTPMLLIKGSTGEYVFSLPMVVLILLLGSWLLSMYVTPFMCFHFMKVKQPDPGVAHRDPYDTSFYRGYRALLVSFLRARYLVLAGTVALLTGAGFLSTLLVKEFFGPSDRNQFLVYFDLPAGYRITSTDAAVQEFSAWLADKDINPEVTSTIFYVGTGGPRFFLSLSPVDPDPHVAFAVVNTQTPDQVLAVLPRAQDYLLANFPDVNARLKRMWMGANEPAYVEFNILGRDIDELYEKGRVIEQALLAVEGIDYVKNSWENRVLRLDVDVDQVRARRSGVTSEEVATSLSSFLDGKAISDYREGDLSIPIILQAADSERQALGDLWNINVYSAEHQVNVPLTQIAEIKGQWQYSRIGREDQENRISIQTRHQFLKATQLVQRMQPVIDDLGLSPDHRLEIGGEIKESAETNEKLFGSLPLCVLLIVLLLVWQFNSFRRPAIIMLTIPMAFGGAMVGLLVMRAPFDFFAILGLLSLAGVIINNGIVLIDRIDGLRAEGSDAFAAIVEATVSRARPILMSAITTILGVAPLIVFRDPLFYSMACVIAFGLALGTVLSLLVVPVIYSFFFNVKAPPRGVPSPPEAAAPVAA